MKRNQNIFFIEEGTALYLQYCSIMSCSAGKNSAGGTIAIQVEFMLSFSQTINKSFRVHWLYNLRITPLFLNNYWYVYVWYIICCFLWFSKLWGLHHCHGCRGWNHPHQPHCMLLLLLLLQEASIRVKLHDKSVALCKCSICLRKLSQLPKSTSEDTESWNNFKF